MRIALPGLLIVGCLLGTSGTASAQIAFVDLLEDWRYDAGGSDLGTAWRDPGFDDAAWSVGHAPVGIAGSAFAVNIGTQFDEDRIPPITVYFRIAFDNPVDPASVDRLTLRLAFADGYAMYLNGTEIARENLPPGTLRFDAPATAEKALAVETVDVSSAATHLRPGRNVLAVELHRVDPILRELFFWAAELTFSTTDEHVTRGPYVQMQTPTSTTLRWRTSIPATSVVRYGSTPDALDQRADAGTPPTTEHAVSLTGLSPFTRYYYAVESSDSRLRGGDADHWFVTSPEVGTAQRTRIWVLGDSGTRNHRQRAVRDAFYAYDSDYETDLILMLGDNAYQNGQDLEYQFAVFEGAYEERIRNLALWPTFGNHDWGDGVSDSTTEFGPYFDIFTLPRNGEAGGMPSGTEAYYSFDYANVHFVCLDSQFPTMEMIDWLEADLATTTQTWLVAFFHHPPYSRGSHDSDEPGGEERMRMVANPILERHGADLVMTGHSHNYERSVLLYGHYGQSAEYAADPTAFALDPGDGADTGDGAYEKPASRGAAQGSVYVVDGNSGGRGGWGYALDHPVMVEMLDPTTGEIRRGTHADGSVVLDVDGLRLDAVYLDPTGAVLDRFTILKGSGTPTGDPDGGAAPGTDAGDADPGDPTADDGCGCAVIGNPRARDGGRAAVLVLLSVLVLRRRRRRRSLCSGCMRCPVCGEVMATRRHGLYEDIEVDECAACDGMWLSRGKLGRLDDSIITDSESLPYVAVEPPSRLMCPACVGSPYRGSSSVPLVTVSPAEDETVVLDRCRRCCGFWLAGATLDQIRDMIFRHDSERGKDMIIWNQEGGSWKPHRTDGKPASKAQLNLVDLLRRVLESRR